MENTSNSLSDNKTNTNSPGTATNNYGMAADATMSAEDYNRIPGWGIDADDENDPTYPMKHYTGADHQRIYYEKPPQQPVDMEILHSIERPTVSRVYGHTLPPKGLSGMIRRKAFQYSEANAFHWMGLILADRVNMVEGLIEDFSNGYVPNIFAERGWNAEWKYNKKGVIKEVLIGAALITGAIAYSAAKKKRKKAKLLKAVKGK
jgi:hypothetical protein